MSTSPEPTRGVAARTTATYARDASSSDRLEPVVSGGEGIGRLAGGGSVRRDPRIGRRLERRHAGEGDGIGARRHPDEDREMDRSAALSHRRIVLVFVVVIVVVTASTTRDDPVFVTTTTLRCVAACFALAMDASSLASFFFACLEVLGQCRRVVGVGGDLGLGGLERGGQLRRLRRSESGAGRSGRLERACSTRQPILEGRDRDGRDRQWRRRGGPGGGRLDRSEPEDQGRDDAENRHEPADRQRTDGHRAGWGIGRRQGGRVACVDGADGTSGRDVVKVGLRLRLAQ